MMVMEKSMKLDVVDGVTDCEQSLEMNLNLLFQWTLSVIQQVIQTI